MYWAVVAFVLPTSVFAVDPPNDALTRFISNATRLIIEPIIWLLFALALFYFVNGVATFMLKADDPKARATGREHMVWGVIGFFIMVSVKFILDVLVGTFNVSLPPNSL